MSNLKKEIVLKGTVFSGKGKGKHFVDLSWARRQFQEKLGFNPYPGTLNLHLSQQSDLDELKKAGGITISPEEGYQEGKCFRALVMGRVWGAVVIPDLQEYPPNLLEVIAPINMREKLGLQDGMELEVAVKIE